MINKNDYKYVFCIGTQKSGTSYLYQILRQHEAIKFSDYKELHFFSEPSEYKKGIENFLGKFKPDYNTIYLADFTPKYVCKADTLKFINQAFGKNTKIVYIMRDPVDRAFSNYCMRYNKGRESRSFHEVITYMLNKNTEADIIRKGLYSEHLDLIYKFFDKDQVVLLEFNEFINNTEEVMRQIVAFLDIKDIKFNLDVKYNPRKKGRIAGLGKLVLMIPLTIRRRLYAKSALIRKVFVGIMERSRKNIKNELKMEKKTAMILAAYYKESNAKIRDKYGVNIDGWK